MSDEVPEELIERRWRARIMGDIEELANTRCPLVDDSRIPVGEEVLESVEERAEFHCSAMTSAERDAVQALALAIRPILDEALRRKSRRIGGKVVHALDTEDFVALGWCDKVVPLARDTFELFLKRGWLHEVG